MLRGYESTPRPVDPEELSDEHGAYLVRLARRALEHIFRTGRPLEPPRDAPEILRRPGAVFVTLETVLPGGRRELRGCIGITRPVYPLVEATIRSAYSSAFEDPRFPPLQEYELDQIAIEVSVLSPFEYLGDTPRERLEGVVIGRDGLVAERGAAAGLLLPSVPVDHLWDRATFLAETCVKAGLWPDCWLDPGTRVYRYRARVWREAEPMGRIEARSLRSEYLSRLRGAGVPEEVERLP